MAKSILVKVTKNGEVLEVNPGTLEAHKRLGWQEVKEEVKAAPLGQTKLMPGQASQADDALKPSAAGDSEEKKEKK